MNKTDAMKCVLLLMVKNESAILERCLAAVESVVDAFCICDTGSTDNTCELAREFLKTHDGCLTEVPWKDFGYNRTQTFVGAQTYLRKTGWDLKTTYGLLLDADMVFSAGSLRSQELGEIGYSIVQINGNLEYPNARLIRMDYDWTCKGVTHEYWDGPTEALSKSICYIDDRNDGGCKSDKFQRDAALLEKGLLDEPENVRYMFYLAQTYNSLHKYTEAIEFYEDRIAAGGWEEEIWYSYYQIGECYKALKNLPMFECWMLKAFERRPTRAEPLYKLARHFRESGEHYKAYHYVLKGRAIPRSTDSLFVEADVYSFLFAYEETILLYYIGQSSKGARASIDFMLRPHCQYQDNVYSNLFFYVEPVNLPSVPHPIPWDTLGDDYHPSSVAFYLQDGKIVHNIRFVNYKIIPQTGSYVMKENGITSADNKVRTQNVWYDPASGKHEVLLDASVTLPRRNAHIVGLEDVRVYHDANGHLKFTATTWEYSEKIRILHGRYHPALAMYSDCVLLDSPGNQECEKNWLAIDGTNDMIYRWYPLQVGTLQGSKLAIHTTHPTPYFFKHLRGSSVGFRPPQYPDEVWCMVHFVEYSTPRKYYHMLMRLNASYSPLFISLPFLFQSKTIEYCLGCLPNPSCTVLHCSFSTMDDMPRLVSIPVSTLSWIPINSNGI